MVQIWFKGAFETASSDLEKGQTSLDPAYLVKWDHNDPLNPLNWSVAYKLWVTFQLAMLSFAGSIGSSITTPADNTIAEYVGVSNEVAVLNVTLYILGFVFGPIFWAPVSEVWGRRFGILPGMFCLGVFSIAMASGRNAASIFIARFFAGFFGSASISNAVAGISDLWSREARGTAISWYAVAVNGGPTLGPIIGAAIMLNPNMGWWWTGYTHAIWVFTVVTVCFFCLPELYPLILLTRKAEKLRKYTNNPKYYHPHENMKLDPRFILTNQLSRPLIMLLTEPVITCIAFYAAFVYSVMYLTLEVFPLAFQEARGWNPLIGSLPFLGLLVGIIGVVGLNIWDQKHHEKVSRSTSAEPVPEERLPLMAIGSICFAAGLFWFAWTAKPPNHWILPCLAAVLIGAGCESIFQQSINFLIDMYKIYSASSTAGITFLRSIMAAGLPLAAKPMIRALDIGPAVSIIGAVGAVLLPVPFLLMRYGPALRKLSKLAPDDL